MCFSFFYSSSFHRFNPFLLNFYFFLNEVLNRDMFTPKLRLDLKLCSGSLGTTLWLCDTQMTWTDFYLSLGVLTSTYTQIKYSSVLQRGMAGGGGEKRVQRLYFDLGNNPNIEQALLKVLSSCYTFTRKRLAGKQLFPSLSGPALLWGIFNYKADLKRTIRAPQHVWKPSSALCSTNRTVFKS